MYYINFYRYSIIYILVLNKIHMYNQYLVLMQAENNFYFFCIVQIGNLQDSFRFVLQNEVSGEHMESKSEAINKETEVTC